MVDQIASGSYAGFAYGVESLVRTGAQSTRLGGVRSDAASTSSASNASKGELSADQQRKVTELSQRDREVRQHEQAHLEVGRDLVRGGPVFQYETGPDKKRYAVAGEVTIDSTPARTPEETIPKAEHIRETALAPAEPSAQDHRVAAKASQMAADARIELATQQREESSVSDEIGLYDGVQQTAGINERLGAVLDLFA